MHEYPSKHVPRSEVTPMGHPFQLRIGDFSYHYNDYTTALEEFHALADDEPGTRLSLFQLGQYAPGKKEWHLVSIANIRGGKRPVWTNLFAGYTLSRLFFLRNADRRELIRLGWPAPADAVSWKYAAEVPPLEQQVAEALEPTAKPLEPVLSTETEPETDVEELDLAAWAADPGCRVDEATLRRRMAMGWDLTRAMTVPMTAKEPGEQEWMIVNGKRRYLPKYWGIPS
jgi:hypothetical protein